jgi:hypothetical protein
MTMGSKMTERAGLATDAEDAQDQIGPLFKRQILTESDPARCLQRRCELRRRGPEGALKSRHEHAEDHRRDARNARTDATTCLSAIATAMATERHAEDQQKPALRG